MLIRAANQHFCYDKSQEHMDLINNFEELVDRVQAIIYEKVYYVEKSVDLNQKKIVDLIFGNGGLIQFLDEKILETKSCEEALEAGHSDGTASHYPSHDIDEIIRERFMNRRRNRIHYNVLEYLFKIVQVLIYDYKDQFIAKQTFDHDYDQSKAFNATRDFIVVLRFIDCITCDSSTPFDEARTLASLKQDNASAIIDIANQSIDLRVIKLAATVLSNASPKAWPVGTEQLNRLMVKFVSLADEGEKMITCGLSNHQDVIKKFKSSLAYELDFEPDKTRSKKPQDESEQTSSLKMEEFEDEEEESGKDADDDFLTNLVQLQTSSTSTGSDNISSLTKPKKLKTVTVETISFDSTLENYLQVLKDSIVEKRKQQESEKMQIDDSSSDKNLSQVTLRDIAEEIFSSQYQHKLNKWNDYTKSNLMKTESFIPKALSNFKKSYPFYHDNMVSKIEACLILSKNVVDEYSFNLAVDTSIQCLRRLILREEQFQYGPTGRKYSKRICETVLMLIHKNLASNCIKLTLKKDNTDSLTQIGQTVALLQTLKQMLRKIKEDKVHPVVQQSEVIDLLLNTQDTDKKKSTFLLDVLNQICGLSTVSGDDDQKQPSLKLDEEVMKEISNPLSKQLLSNHRFQSQMWLITQQVYEILCHLVRHNNVQSIRLEVQQQYLKAKKEIEIIAQQTLLKNVMIFDSCNYFVHHMDMMRLIVQHFIRSAWVLEGFAPNPLGANTGNENLQKLIKYTCSMIKSVEQKSFYIIDKSYSDSNSISGRIQIPKDDLVIFIYLLIRRLTLDNRAPNHPAPYDAAILSSELFSDDIFGKVISAPIISENGERIDRFNNSRLKNVFIQSLGTICSNDPAQISKLVDNGILQKVVSAIIPVFPVHSGTIPVFMEFIRQVMIQEKGREFIKKNHVYERLIMPATLPIHGTERKGGESDQNDLDMVIETANNDKYKKNSNHAFLEMIRQPDSYFPDTTQKAVSEILAHLIPKAQFLQNQYYTTMEQCAKDPKISKKHFQILVTEKLVSYPDYHIIKFEMEKLNSLCYSSMYDQSALIPVINKVFQGELQNLFLLFEILSTIKPVLDFGKKQSQFKQNSVLHWFHQIFSILVNDSKNPSSSDGLKIFENRLRQGCKNLESVLTLAQPDQQEKGEFSIKKIDLLKYLQSDSKLTVKLPQDESLENSIFKNINESNVRGHLIARVLIIGQYINGMEVLKKATQEILCITREWSNELRILSCFMTSFDGCNHNITDQFFQDQQKFIQLGVVTDIQIQQVSIPYSKGMTTKDKDDFQVVRKQIEENIDLYRENITYLDLDFIDINRLLQFVWEFLRAPQHRRGNSVDELIIESKKAYTKLTIDNIKDLNQVIDDFEILITDFNEIKFLTTISRLYTYISGLFQLITNEKLCGGTFYQFVEQGCLSNLVKIFNILKSFSIKKLSKEQDEKKKMKFIAVDCLQSINKQLGLVLTCFINCSKNLIVSHTPPLNTIIQEDGLYDSTQHFFMNFIHNLVEQLAQEEGADKNSQLGEKQIDTKIKLYENKDLRNVQILLIQQISKGFPKCTFLSDEYGKPFTQDEKGAKEAAKPKKIHHDDKLISQITCMGFDRVLAKKALKLTGDVGNAVTFLLESGEAGLTQVSDSEEEPEKKDEKEVKVEQENQEEENKKAELVKKEKKEKLISVDYFKAYLKSIQKMGLEVVSFWSTLTPQEAKVVPYSTQKKYWKIYETNIISLAKSPNQTEENLTQLYDKIIGAFEQNVLKLSSPQDEGIESLAALYLETKNYLSLLQKMSIDVFKPILRLQGYERNTKLIVGIQTTLKTLTSAVDDKSNQQRNDQLSEKVRFLYLSNILELIYKSLLLFLVYQQIIISKNDKCLNQLRELEKEDKLRKEKGLDKDSNEAFHKNGQVAKLQQKVKTLSTKYDNLKTQEVATDAIKFIDKIRQNHYAIKVPKKYAGHLNNILGQIIDISRMVLVTKKSGESAKESSIASETSQQIVMKSDLTQSSRLMTSGTATLNIIQVQQMAYNEEYLQSQIEHLIKWMMEVRAKRTAEYNKSKEVNELDDKSQKSDKSNASKPAFEQKDTVEDFKSFANEFQTQVLGIGKAPNAPNQNRYGAPAAVSNLSQPSNEMANQMFQSVFKKAIAQVCDVTMKKEVPKAPPGEENSESFKTYAQLLKNQNMKEALTSSKIQLKQNVIDKILQKQDVLPQQAYPDNSQLIYKTIYSEMKEYTQPWYDELNSFIQMQQVNNKLVIKLSQSKEDIFVGSADAQDQWQELTLIGLRNISNLVRTCLDGESGLVQSILDDKSGLIHWFKDVYLPLRLIKKQYQEKPQDDSSNNEITIETWFELDKCIQVEKLDKNICLFLNELTGHGHIYCEKAQKQRQNLREQMLLTCYETLQNQACNKDGVRNLNVLQQAQILSSVLIIQHLTNQFNQHEYNRVVLSRTCYAQSIRFLIEQGYKQEGSNQIQPSQNMRFVSIINNILAQVVKMPSASAELQDENDGQIIPKQFTSLQNMVQVLIQRCFNIFTTVAIFLEGEKKHKKQFLEIQKKKKETQLLKEKKRNEAKNDKLMREGQVINDQQPSNGAQNPSTDAQLGQNGSTGFNLLSHLEPVNDQIQGEDALMQAESDDDDNDIHGEGSMSQQHDHLQIQQEVQNLDQMQGLAHELDEDEEPDDMEDDDDQLGDEDQMIIQQQVDEHGNDVLIVDEEEDELIEDGMDDENNEGHEMDEEEQEDEDEDMEDDFDDLPSDEDDGDMFPPIGLNNPHGRHRAGGRQNPSNQRDILFNGGDVGPQRVGGPISFPPGDHRLRIERPGGFVVQGRAGREVEDPLMYGPNWSREEEEVSQTLRNLRGLSSMPDANAPNLPPQHQVLIPATGSTNQNCRYRIEYDVCKQFIDNSSLANAKKSIEIIKQEQGKPANNQISTIFQILKPIDLQGQCFIAQGIDQEFLKGAISRENIRIELEQTERKKNLEDNNGEVDERINNGIYLDESEDEEVSTSIDNAPAPMLPPMGLFREMLASGRVDAHSVIQDRLMDIRMDIERLLQEGMAVGLRDPLLEMDDPFGLVFQGEHGYQPRQLQRERDRANLANVQRDVREQAVNWESNIYRLPEASIQDNTTNLIQSLIEEENVVLNEVEVPMEPAQARNEDDNSSESRLSQSQSLSQSRPSQQRSLEEFKFANAAQAEPPSNNNQGQRPEPEGSSEQILPGLNDIMDRLRMQGNGNNPDTEPLADNAQQQLSSFFGSLNIPAQAEQLPVADAQEQPEQQPVAAAENSNGSSSLQMGGINNALNDIRDEFQNNQRDIDQAIDDAFERIVGDNDQMIEQPNAQVIEPLEQIEESVQQPVAQPQLIEEDQNVASSLVNADDEMNQQPEVQPSTSSFQAQAQAPVIPQEDMTFGYPNSLLLENEIDPLMLHELPEEVRAEILSTIQDQFEQWQRNQQQPAQQNSVQMQEVQSEPVAQQNQNEMTSSLIDEQPVAEGQQPAAEQQNQQPAEEIDPEIAQAIAMGIDPEFLANLPPDLRRELVRDETFRAHNTGRPVDAAPMREPEAMDVASIIATVQDPALRREMLQNLSQEQIDALPSSLRTEAMNFRRGNPGGLFGNMPPRPNRNFDQIMGGRLARDQLVREMDSVVNRMRGEPGFPSTQAKAKVLANPKDIAFDQLLIDYTVELDEKMQDHWLSSEKTISIIKRIQDQLLEDQDDIKADHQEDLLLKNLLTTICLNSSIKTDIVQFLRLILKQKSQLAQASSTQDIQYGYQYRNKVLNTLAFVMKLAAKKDTKLLMNLFEIEIPEAQISKVKISDLQWNKIFLTVTGILRVLIDSNKKLILHMLKCLIQRDEYFVNKGDHLISSHLKILEHNGERSNLRPPLAEIIQIMREQSEDHHQNTKKQNQTPNEKKECEEQLIRVRNIKLLIQDVFKQFDLLFHEISMQQEAAQRKNGGQQVPGQGINLGELSKDSVKSLTDLLYMPLIDKKLLNALGDFMFRLSNLKDLSTQQKCSEKNLRNWSMISEQCMNIANINLEELNGHLLSAHMLFSTYGISVTEGLNRSQSQLERVSSQISNGAKLDQQADQIMREEQHALTSGPGPQAIPQSKQMKKEQEEEFKEQLVLFKSTSSPLMHILSLYSFFFQRFNEEKTQLEAKIKDIADTVSKQELSWKEVIDKITESKKQGTEIKVGEEDKSSLEPIKDAVVTDETLKNEVKTEKTAEQLAQEVKDQEEDAKALTKEIDENKSKLADLQSSLQQKKDFIGDIRDFFKIEKIEMLIHQISSLLSIIQQTNPEMIESAKTMVNCVFDCFMPEMLDEVVKAAKERDAKLAAAKRAGRSQFEDQKEAGDSKYVSMEPIAKINSEAENQEAHLPSILVESSLQLTPNKDKRNTKDSNKRALIFRDVEEASERLCKFNLFCLQNKAMLNLLVKNVFGASAREKDNYSKEMGTVTEYIKFMPHLLDFENKRVYFKREIKKMRRASYARDLVLSIRRKDIFMDAYSQLSHLSANELKGKISVDFAGERGQDVGGLTRDFFIELSKEMFNQSYSLFKRSDNGSTYMPDPKSYVQADHLRFFKFIGRAIGKALFENCLLECYFVRSIYKMIIGQKLNFKDLEDFDNSLYTGLNWCLQPSSDVDALYETFSTSVDYFGRTETIDLVPGGRDIDVTNENKEFYVERKTYHHLYQSVQQQIDCFLDGFYEIIPRDLVAIFTHKELELLISGLPDFSVADLRAHTNYNGYSANSPQIQWFWEIVESFDRTEKGNLLQFATGSSKVPVEGFAKLQGMNGVEKFQLTRIIVNDPMRLPQGHTCFNQIDLPEYSSKEILYERLMWAIKETAGFGFA